jgi:hypothetical protein
MVRSFLFFTVLLCLLLPLIDCGSSRKLQPASCYDLVDTTKTKAWTKPAKSADMSLVDSAFSSSNDSIRTKSDSTSAKIETTRIDSAKKE